MEKPQYNQGDLIQSRPAMTKDGIVKQLAVIIKVFSNGDYDFYDIVFLSTGRNCIIEIKQIEYSGAWTLLARGQ
jgi:hypothetical protein